MASRSQGIRETIQLLSTILSHCEVPKIPSESFRQAKFNKPQATTTFWILLFHVVQTVQFLDQSGCDSMPDRVHKFSEETFKRTAFEVRKYLFMLGYTRMEFYSRHDLVGSRELLLGFAWLIKKSDFFSKLTQYHLKAGNRVSIPLKTSRKFLLKEVEKGVMSFRNEVGLLLKTLSQESLDSESLRQHLQKLVWLRGKLFSSWRTMLAAHHAYQKLADQVHKHTMSAPPPGSPHLTVHQLFLLRHSDQLASHLKHVEHHVLALQKLTEWQLHEATFWQWMESVLDLCEKEEEEEKLRVQMEESSEGKGVKEDEKAGKCEALNVEALLIAVQTLEREVLGLLERYKPHSDKVHHVWKLKARYLEPEELQSEQQKIEECLQYFRLSLKDWSDTLQTLRPSDNAVCVPNVVSVTRKTKLEPFPSLVQQQQEVSRRQLEASNSKLAQLEGELARIGENIHRLKLGILKQLQTVLEQLPSSVCKIDSGMI